MWCYRAVPEIRTHEVPHLCQDLTSWKSVVISLQPHLESCRSNGMVGQTTLDSYFRSSRTSEADPDRSIPASNDLPSSSIGAAAAALPNVADLFANAFKPLGNTAPTNDVGLLWDKWLYLVKVPLRGK
ncbi:hypothetical protein Pst134EA_003203 [Puccinia striiformis f. sp. tritici]|uniref:hypothetical protein n=1 Tax=Puccinia striiformis f. sp. tritici TaxID=168172 RepID=UPI002007AABE|nr:hypothetical protein Pst134EA_003203 [Puccinia striiformis f. sp. tritici]KAH9472596.1 hypothetical protein Pst134EA_003203 [Puccinia striiformis f. sp. tritici]